MRKGFEGLYGLVRDRLQLEPLSGHVFIFCNKARNRTKADYLPIYRQSAILKRETGIDLSRATLDSWVMRVGELSRPITAAMGQELLSGSYLQADFPINRIAELTPTAWAVRN